MITCEKITVQTDVDSILNEEEIDDIDTAVDDGSGTINVRADSASQITPTEFEFYNVTIEVSGDYNNWGEQSLLTEARSMLERDYTVEAI